MTRSNADALLTGNRLTLAGYEARHFGWSVAGKVATITLNRVASGTGTAAARRPPQKNAGTSPVRFIFLHSR